MTALETERACRICGCTEHTACVDLFGDACHWAESDLCSACAYSPVVYEVSHPRRAAFASAGAVGFVRGAA